MTCSKAPPPHSWDEGYTAFYLPSAGLTLGQPEKTLCAPCFGLRTPKPSGFSLLIAAFRKTRVKTATSALLYYRTSFLDPQPMRCYSQDADVPFLEELKMCVRPQSFFQGALAAPQPPPLSEVRQKDTTSSFPPRFELHKLY